MTNLSAKSRHTMVDKLQTDKEMFENFYKFYYSGSKNRPPCDPACRHRLICSLVSARSHDREETCKEVSVRSNRVEVVTSWWEWWDLVGGWWTE